MTLIYNDSGFYQLHWFKIDLPNPAELEWYYPEVVKNGQCVIAGHINGNDKNGGRVFEWYSDSGGQMKYYPLASSAVWASPIFKLEPIPENVSKIELCTKAKIYFPEKWQKYQVSSKFIRILRFPKPSKCKGGVQAVSLNPQPADVALELYVSLFFQIRNDRPCRFLDGHF